MTKNNNDFEKPAYLAHLSDDELNELDTQTRREERNLKIGAAVIGGIMLLSVFSAVASLATMPHETDVAAQPTNVLVLEPPRP